MGLGQSRQKYEFLPQVSTDSIFAIIAEEVGFIGAAILIAALFYLVFRAITIARFAPDEFSRLLASAIAGWLGIQTVINLSAMLALLPLTGVPLPFISYGGSSLVVNLAAVGILLNISRLCVNPKKSMTQPKILLTGAHLTPALALQSELEKHHFQVEFLTLNSPKFNRHKPIKSFLSFFKLPYFIFLSLQKIKQLHPR